MLPFSGSPPKFGAGMNLPAETDQRSRVAEFQRKHRVGLVTLLFTDIVGSTKLKQELGDHDAVMLIHQHHDFHAFSGLRDANAVAAATRT